MLTLLREIIFVSDKEKQREYCSKIYKWYNDKINSKELERIKVRAPSAKDKERQKEILIKLEKKMKTRKPPKTPSPPLELNDEIPVEI